MSELRAEGLTTRYRARQVVNSVSLLLSGGEVVGLLGPNGAGKTTCFYMIVGLIRSDAGTIRLDERDITASPMHVRARLGLGYLPQAASVFRELTVRETLGICGRAYIMSEGLVIAEGAPDLILQNARVRQVYLGEHFTL